MTKPIDCTDRRRLELALLVYRAADRIRVRKEEWRRIREMMEAR